MGKLDMNACRCCAGERWRLARSEWIGSLCCAAALDAGRVALTGANIVGERRKVVGMPGS
jgi:hypothetical protein